MRTLLAIFSLAALAPVAAADIVFSDTEFPTSGWGVESVLIGGGGSVTPTQVFSGGNPGAFRRVDMTLGSTTGDAIYSLHRYGTTTATRYDPATQGAITSIDFSIDYRDVPGASPTSHQTVFVAAKQGTLVFAGPGLLQSFNQIFLPFSATGLTAASFTAVGAPGTLDFSTAGAPIRFGFITYIANTSGAFPSRSEYDNFVVNIHQAPAPGTLVLAGLAGLVASRRRRG